VEEAPSSHEALHVLVLNVERHLAKLGFGHEVGPYVGGVAALLGRGDRAEDSLAARVRIGIVGRDAADADFVAERVGVIGRA
jgi:hypothetical protein